MNKEIIKGIVRHALTAAGAGWCTSGVMTNDDLGQIVGGIVALIGVIWSVLQKRGAAKAIVPLLLCGALLAPCLGTGCANPEQAAYRTLGTIGVTASAAHEVWKAYAATGKPSADDRAKVSAIWNQYCAAYAAACDAGKTANQSHDLTAMQVAMKVLENCEADLIAAVKQFLPADLAATLNGGS